MMGRNDREAAQAPSAPGEPGAWVFIVGDMAIFTALFAAILYYRGEHPDMFAAGQATLSQELGTLNTVILLLGSILVVLATRASAAARNDAAARLVAAGASCGLLFAAVKGLEYGRVLNEGHSMHTNDFFMLFFVVTGAHLLHVLLGTTALAAMRRRVAAGLPGIRDRTIFETSACYWHLVDLLWLIIFPLFYLVN